MLMLKNMYDPYTIPVSITQLCDVKQTKICDHNFVSIKEDIFGLQVFVYNSLGVKVAHALEKVGKMVKIMT